MDNDYPSNLHKIVSRRGRQKRAMHARFEPRTLEINRPVFPMRECSLTMDDDTVIEARYVNKASLRSALEEMLRLLEMEG